MPWRIVDLDDDLRLIVSVEVVMRDDWSRFLGEFGMSRSATTSRSSADGYRAVLTATTGRVGVDLETLERIALNGTIDDRWLAVGDRVLVQQATDPILELACHWVLKEAYGKALGVGLALPLNAIAFGGSAAAIIATGTAAPESSEGWRFGLYRCADTVLGVAFQPIKRQCRLPLREENHRRWCSTDRASSALERSCG